MRTARRLLCLAAMIHGAGLAQSSDPRELLLRVRENVSRTLSSLPRYLCTLTIDREQYTRDPGAAQSCEQISKLEADGRKGRLAVTDRLRLDVAIAAANEIYSWVGEDHFDNRDVFQLVRDGALQTGAFSTFLSSIFTTDTATFSYQGQAIVDGRTLAEFGFEVPRERSNYVFGNRQQDAIVGYDGSFLADPLTADLFRLTVRTGQLPSDTGACLATTTLDYARIRLNNSDFLLPREARLDILNTTGDRLHNTTVYSSCHEFVGESVLKFGGEESPPTPREASASKAPLPETIPSGIPFRIRFAQDIDTGTVAAGDRVHAELAAPLRDPSSRAVLIPAGVKITARIVKLQHFFGAAPSLRMQVKLETVSSGNSSRPLAARPAAEVTNAGIPLGSFSSTADPDIGSVELRNAGAGFIIESGFESSWVTVHP